MWKHHYTFSKKLGLFNNCVIWRENFMWKAWQSSQFTCQQNNLWAFPKFQSQYHKLTWFLQYHVVLDQLCVCVCVMIVTLTVLIFLKLFQSWFLPLRAWVYLGICVCKTNLCCMPCELGFWLLVSLFITVSRAVIHVERLEFALV